MLHNCTMWEFSMFFMGALFGAAVLCAGIFPAIHLDSPGMLP